MVCTTHRYGTPEEDIYDFEVPGCKMVDDDKKLEEVIVQTGFRPPKEVHSDPFAYNDPLGDAIMDQFEDHMFEEAFGSQPKKNDVAPNKDKYACLKAVGMGALRSAVDPVALIVGAGFGAGKMYGPVTRAVFPLGRALSLVRVAVPAFALSTAAAGVVGAVKSYMTDEACK